MAALAACVATAVLTLSGCMGNTVDASRMFTQSPAAFDKTIDQRLSATLDQAVKQSGSSGAIAGVWAPWGGSWQVATGRSGFGDGAPKATVGESVHLGPITGDVTCTILLRLVDEEVVELDDPVSKYVDTMPGLDGITLRELCQQTSGLADYYPSLRPFLVGNPERTWSDGELISGGLATDSSVAPGTRYAYSRTGLLLLAQALQHRTGKTWAQLAHDEVFGPLGITSIRLPAPDDVAATGVLDGYSARLGLDGAPDCAARVDVSHLSSSSGGAASGAVGTVADIQKLSEAFATGALLSKATTRAQWTTIGVGDAPAWQAYGVGGAVYGPMRGTAGDEVGALTAAFTDPKSGLTVVLALNNSTSGPDFVRQVAFALASIASKAPASGGAKQPLVALPWSAEQAIAAMGQLAKCPPPADAAKG